MAEATTAVHDERKVIAAIFSCLQMEGMKWYLNSRQPGVAYLDSKLRGRWAAMENDEIEIEDKAASSFPTGKLLILVPPDRDPEPLVGVWCRWDFAGTSEECHFYLGMWSKQDPAAAAAQAMPAAQVAPLVGTVEHTFVGYRFESPHDGEGHDYFHCQPCRSLGRGNGSEPATVLVSEVGPTFALSASNNLELALNLVLALRGRTGLRSFRRNLYAFASGTHKDTVLEAAFRRLLD